MVFHLGFFVLQKEIAYCEKLHGKRENISPFFVLLLAKMIMLQNY
jgi:hypothetical protein